MCRPGHPRLSVGWLLGNEYCSAIVVKNIQVSVCCFFLNLLFISFLFVWADFLTNVNNYAFDRQRQELLFNK